MKEGLCSKILGSFCPIRKELISHRVASMLESLGVENLMGKENTSCITIRTRTKVLSIRVSGKTGS